MFNFLLMMIIIPVIAIMLSRNLSLSRSTRKLSLLVAFGSWSLYILPIFINLLWSAVIAVVLIFIAYLIITRIMR